MEKRQKNCDTILSVADSKCKTPYYPKTLPPFKPNLQKLDKRKASHEVRKVFG